MQGRLLATVQADDAARVATRDRTGTADLVLALAVHEAIDHLREHRPSSRARAVLALTRGGLSAERILGRGGC